MVLIWLTEKTQTLHFFFLLHVWISIAAEAISTRQCSVQNYHITVKKRNVSATISMPPIGKDDPMGCLSCPTPHSLAESLREGLPIVIFLTDQTFPPVLPPTGDGNCTVITDPALHVRGLCRNGSGRDSPLNKEEKNTDCAHPTDWA